MAARLTIIIPTYNRNAILRRALEAHGRQSAAQEILEILVIDDGSTDGTPTVVAEISRVCSVPVRYLSQANRGLAAARNHGMREARGELILFVDDDVIPSPNLVAEHLAWHERCPQPVVGVLGYVPWSPEVRPTPFMEWLALHGVQYAFASLSRGAEVDFPYFYFSNTSLKADFLRESGTFDEDFLCGYEDIEFGYRLKQNGARLLYNPDAVGYHLKYMSFADTMRRAQHMAAEERIFATKEAGIQLGKRSRLPDAGTGRRLRKVLAEFLAPALIPLTPLLDTQVPLPCKIYSHLYHYYARKASNVVAATR